MDRVLQKMSIVTIGIILICNHYDPDFYEA